MLPRVPCECPHTPLMSHFVSDGLVGSMGLCSFGRHQERVASWPPTLAGSLLCGCRSTCSPAQQVGICHCSRCPQCLMHVTSGCACGTHM